MMKNSSCVNSLVLLLLLLAHSLCAASVIYVDDNAENDPSPFDSYGSDPDESGSLEHPFDTIQEALDAVETGGVIEVMPGSYPDPDLYGDNRIYFNGKNCILRSTDPNDWDVVNNTHINGVVLFNGAVDSNCVLDGFRIHNLNTGAIYGYGSDATISHCIISGNITCRSTVISNCDGLINNCLIVDNYTTGACGLDYIISDCDGTIRSCTIANNVSGIGVGTAKIENTIIYGNQNNQVEVYNGGEVEISYCNIQGGYAGVEGLGDIIWGVGNIDSDPCFVREGFWYLDGYEYKLYPGDYHLQSYGWRVSNEKPLTWTYDYHTSRCIDAGNPGCSLLGELETVVNDPQNYYGVNTRINMGAYGGTSQSSMGPIGLSLLADINNDGVVDVEDFSWLAENWLSSEEKCPADLDKNGIINIKDYGFMAEIWDVNASWRQ